MPERASGTVRSGRHVSVAPHPGTYFRKERFPVLALVIVVFVLYELIAVVAAARSSVPASSGDTGSLAAGTAAHRGGQPAPARRRGTRAA